MGTFSDGRRFEGKHTSYVMVWAGKRGLASGRARERSSSCAERVSQLRYASSGASWTEASASVGVDEV